MSDEAESGAISEEELKALLESEDLGNLLTEPPPADRKVEEKASEKVQVLQPQNENPNTETNISEDELAALLEGEDEVEEQAANTGISEDELAALLGSEAEDDSQSATPGISEDELAALLGSEADDAAPGISEDELSALLEGEDDIVFDDGPISDAPPSKEQKSEESKSDDDPGGLVSPSVGQGESIMSQEMIDALLAQMNSDDD